MRSGVHHRSAHGGRIERNRWNVNEKQEDHFEQAKSAPRKEIVSSEETRRSRRRRRRGSSSSRDDDDVARRVAATKATVMVVETKLKGVVHRRQ